MGRYVFWGKALECFALVQHSHWVSTSLAQRPWFHAEDMRGPCTLQVPSSFGLHVLSHRFTVDTQGGSVVQW